MSSRIIRITRQVKRVWGELDYAQRRSFEITTGIPVTPRGTEAIARTEISELEAALAQPHPAEQPILDPAAESVAEAVAI
jgi:BMFP domain-containing protein YqiC